MKKRSLLSLAVAIALWSETTFALSIGEARLFSSYGEPLNVEIAIHRIVPRELEDFEIKLASLQIQQAAGIEWAPLHDALKFKLIKTDSNPAIKVLTIKPINDLSLSFIVEVSAGGTKIIKQFDLLFEPTGLSGRRTVPVDGSEMVVKADDSPAPLPEVVADEPQKREPQPSVFVRKQEHAGSSQYGPVRPGETLSEIAYAIRPDRAMGLPQVILALYKKNLQAFLDEDINNLKAGSRLRVPDEQLILAVPKADAMQLVSDLFKGKTRLTQDSSVAANTGKQKNSTDTATTGKIERSFIAQELSDEQIASDFAQLDKLALDPAQGQNLKLTDLQKELKATRAAAKALQQRNEKLKQKLGSLFASVNKMQEKLGIEKQQNLKPDDNQKYLVLLGNDDSIEASELAVGAETDARDDSNIFIPEQSDETTAATSDLTRALQARQNSKSTSILDTKQTNEPQFIEVSKEEGEKNFYTIGGISLVSLLLLGFAARNYREQILRWYEHKKLSRPKGNIWK